MTWQEENFEINWLRFLDLFSRWSPTLTLRLLRLYGQFSRSSLQCALTWNFTNRILAGIPLCALFVLFDQVISNPRSPDTRSNLALLDIAGGHFGRIDFTSGGSLPGSLISEFTYIAREYINQLATYDLLQGPQSSFQLLNQASRPLATEPISVPSVSSQSNGQKMGSITVSPFAVCYLMLCLTI
jgi:hypothetical protein